MVGSRACRNAEGAQLIVLVGNDTDDAQAPRLLDTKIS